MGQNSSTSSGSQVLRRRSFRSSWRPPFPRRSHIHQNTLSAAVNFIDIDPKHVELLNVNTASEEELMTLPGINRNIARSIVEYRQAIGRFKKVEDLALVSGIGAEKLDLIRPEICVKNKTASCASSRAQSIDSIPASETSHYGGVCNRLIDVNSASVFELMAINGLNQELAANIVEQRIRRGPFRNLEDLMKVKGINSLRLGSIRSQIIIKPPIDDVPVQNGYVGSKRSQNSFTITDGHSKMLYPTLKHSNTSNGFLAIGDIFELLSASTQRPIVEDFQYERNGKPAIRVASWNLHNLTVDKISNPGVKEIFCRTILENKFSVIAVQEIIDNLALKMVCDELNSPTLHKVAEWKDNSRNWRFCVCNKSSGYSKGSYTVGFLYDARNNLELYNLKEIRLEENSIILPEIEMFQASLKMNVFRLSLANIHIRHANTDCVTYIEKAVLQNFKENEMLVILGDFSGLRKNEEIDEILRLNYKTVIPTSISSNTTDHSGIKYADNIFLNLEAQSHFTGTWGIVRQGLTHLAIPKGWMWGGAASEHCPVWCELFTDRIPPRN